MELHAHLERLLRYDDWANRETLAGLKQVAVPPGATRLFAHIIAAERLWLDRVARAPQSVDPWPAWDLQQSAAELAGLLPAWREVLGEHPGSQLEHVVRYTNTKGEPWTNTVLDVVTHVVLHSAYHRGQIAAAERAAGREPAYTDFIHCTRRGLLG
jgi:uncharacterized damage-inducible protein DinB